MKIKGIIRDLQLSDADAICRIYNYYIKNTVITFEEDVVSIDIMRERIKKILKKEYPYIIYEENNRVLGYAYLNNWRDRSAFNITLETSIYIGHEYTGKGIGTLLYSKLIEKAKLLDIHSVIGCISLPNPNSQKLHERLNFKLVGNFKEAGKKNGKLIDVEFWQLTLN